MPGPGEQDFVREQQKAREEEEEEEEQPAGDNETRRRPELKLTGLAAAQVRPR